MELISASATCFDLVYSSALLQADSVKLLLTADAQTGQ